VNHQLTRVAGGHGEGGDGAPEGEEENEDWIHQLWELPPACRERQDLRQRVIASFSTLSAVAPPWLSKCLDVIFSLLGKRRNFDDKLRNSMELCGRHRFLGD